MFSQFSLLVCCLANVGQVFSSAISFTSSSSSLQLGGTGISPTIKLDYQDWPGVIRTAHDLATDFGRVTGTNGTVLLTNSTTSATTSYIIIAGTIGNSTLIDGLISAGKIDVSAIEGKWESYSSQLVSSPIAGVSKALVISGSDKRGTIYGLYDISKQMGVSPWHWWADVPTVARTAIYATDAVKIQGPPSVKYRGIFINDEAPSLTGWIQANFPNGAFGPGYNADFYSLVFELLLRLRANYLWPAMWSSMFYADDANNGPNADYFGIVMGTSHTEPMARATNEEGYWLTGDWDWVSNSQYVKWFMSYGVTRAKTWETMWTMGMRGAGDTASPTLNASTLETIIEWQKAELVSTIGKAATDIPKMWCLYKEVGGYYQAGLTVPEDITLLWTDDNQGNIQRIPLANETGRSGGAGIYYHFDYVGSVRNYKWINSIQLSKTWEQMHFAYQRNATEIWIANVGDLKPLEIPISHFLDMAYDMTNHATPSSTDAWLLSWATSQFRSGVAAGAAAVMATYGKLIIRRKYEMLDTLPLALSVGNYDEAENVLQEWTTLLSTAQSLYNSLDAATRTPFFEMVLHPVLAGKTVQEIYIKAALNAWYAKQRRTSTNSMATQVIAAYAADASITARYNGLLNGKWNHMMDQPHLGYTTWNDPVGGNSLPILAYVSNSTVPASGIMGISVQGSATSVPGDSALTLIPMNPYMTAKDVRYIDIYTRDNGTFDYTITTNASYVTVSPSSGTLVYSGTSDVRANINVTWASVPTGVSNVFITVTRTGANSEILTLPLNKTAVASTFTGFVESNRALAFEAEHYTAITTGSTASYITIPNYGRTLSGVTLSPVTCPSQTTTSGPKLSYSFHAFTATTGAKISVMVGSSLNLDPTRPLTFALQLDSGVVSTTQPVPSTNLGTLPSGWDTAVNGDGYTSNVYRNVAAGNHTLNIWLLEPGLVLQKIVIDLGGVKTSLLGPPESKIV